MYSASQSTSTNAASGDTNDAFSGAYVYNGSMNIGGSGGASQSSDASATAATSTDASKQNIWMMIAIGAAAAFAAYLVAKR